MIGKISKVDASKFITFEIKDEDGRIHKALWLTYVDHDDLLEESKKTKNNLGFYNCGIRYVRSSYRRVPQQAYSRLNRYKTRINERKTRL
jgi:hypothetical protein